MGCHLLENTEDFKNWQIWDSRFLKSTAFSEILTKIKDMLCINTEHNTVNT